MSEPQFNQSSAGDGMNHCLVNMETGETMTVPAEAIAELGIREPWKDAETFTDDDWLQAMKLTTKTDAND